MKTGEAFGTATVFLGDSQISQTLTHTFREVWDWEGELFVPENTNLFEADLIGQFVDRVGNVAQTTAPKRININSPPFNVTVFEPEVELATASLRLNWTAARDADFSKVIIERYPDMLEPE